MFYLSVVFVTFVFGLGKLDDHLFGKEPVILLFIHVVAFLSCLSSLVSGNGC